ncbi:hypothetical protein BDIM_11790 [Brevundimonas diminuta ATCC 11568]|nr:hypothetical protein BDIM_11790 [Brevundimonas diminuta ATCC 11568]
MFEHRHMRHPETDMQPPLATLCDALAAMTRLNASGMR